MKCSKCSSENYRTRNYDPYTNRFIYECSHCGSVIDCFNNETIYTNKSINTNKSIELNDTTNHNDYYVNYDEIYKNNQIQGNLSPNEVKIMADKITITERSIGITLDLSDKNCFDKVDSIVVNGIRFNREFKDADGDCQICTSFSKRVILPETISQ